MTSALVLPPRPVFSAHEAICRSNSYAARALRRITAITSNPLAMSAYVPGSGTVVVAPFTDTLFMAKSLGDANADTPAKRTPRILPLVLLMPAKTAEPSPALVELPLKLKKVSTLPDRSSALMRPTNEPG